MAESGEQNIVKYTFDSQVETPYKKRIVSEFHYKDPKFWKEDKDLVYKTGNIQLRAGFDEDRSEGTIYIKKEYGSTKDKGINYKPSIVKLPKALIRGFLFWLKPCSQELAEIIFPEMLPALKKDLENAYLEKIDNKIPKTFYDKGLIFNRDGFRVKLVYDRFSFTHKFYLNNEGKSEQYASWAGPSIEVSNGELVRIANFMMELDSAF